MNKKQLQFPAAHSPQLDFTTNCGGESQNFQPLPKLAFFMGS